MELVTVVCILAIWLICGFLGCIHIYGYFQYKYPNLAREDKATDRRLAIKGLILGPISLLIAARYRGYPYLIPYSKKDKNYPEYDPGFS